MPRSTLVPALLLASLAAGSRLEAQKSPAAASVITIGQTVRGTIASSDPKLDDGSHYDNWRLRGQRGQRVEIVMESADFDAYLKLSQTGSDDAVDTDDDGAGGTNARIIVTLEDGDYLISANTLSADETGSYTLRVTALPPAAAPRAAVPLTGNTVNGTLNDSDPLAEDETYYDDYRYTAKAREAVTIELTSPDFDAYLEVGRMEDGKFESLKSNDDGPEGTDAKLEYTFPAAGDYIIRANTLTSGEKGAYVLRLNSTGVRPVVAQPAARPIRLGETLTGTLAETDPLADDDTYYDEFVFTGPANERVVIDLASPDFDSYLLLGKMVDGEFETLAQNDDNQDGGNGSTVVYTLPAAGQYIIRANSLGKSTGAYTVSVRSLK